MNRESKRYFMDFDVLDLGMIDYEVCFALQKKLHNQIYENNSKNVLMILEHFPVITLGRTGKRENVLAKDELLKELNIKVLSVNRGGDVTIHMPGQLVAYPIFDLKQWQKNVHLFVFTLEEVMIRFFCEYGVTAKRKKNYPGVWVEDEKIGFIGTGISKWISFHGVSLNLNTNKKIFSLIRPCGIDKLGVTSLTEIVGKTLDMEQARKVFANTFKNVFSYS